MYVRSNDKVIVHCPEHGDWEITPSNHLRQRGCPKCGREYLKKLHSKSLEKFLQDAKAIHGDKYGYEDVVYNNSKIHVKIKCYEHGTWEQMPLNHLKGYGCPVCASIERGLAQRTAQEDYILSVSSEHENKYDYTFARYEGLLNKIDIICPVHGKFSMRAGTHKGSKYRPGAGCPKCAINGYSKAKPGLLYVLVTPCGLTKIGITNRDLKHRIRAVRRSSGYQFSEAHSYWMEDGEIIADMETLLLRELKSSYEQPTEKFDGSTETFKNVDVINLLQRITELIKECEDTLNQEV